MTVVQENEKLAADLVATVATVQAVTAERDAAQASVLQLGGQVVELNAQLAKLTGDLEAAEGLIASEQAAHAETKAALAKIETAVASNPAFADAGAQGAEAPAADGSPAGEPKAEKTFDQWHAEYIRVRDNEGPVAAAEFRAKHKSELRLV
jgi:outer membrane murein-binding lipoprotein Lpp